MATSLRWRRHSDRTKIFVSELSGGIQKEENVVNTERSKVHDTKLFVHIDIVCFLEVKTGGRILLLPGLLKFLINKLGNDKFSRILNVLENWQQLRKK